MPLLPQYLSPSAPSASAFSAAMSDPSSLLNTIGDLIGPFNLSAPLRITYNHRLVINGCDLRPSATVSRPMVEVGGEDFSVFYTLLASVMSVVSLLKAGDLKPPDDGSLVESATQIVKHDRSSYGRIMVDLDAPNPSNPTLREYLHWIVTDIPGTTNVRFGRELMSYESPRPVIGIHRIVFILFRQLGRNTVFEPELRHNFSARNFAQEYNLTTFSVAYFNSQREAGSGGRRLQN